jgi:hypothetical protein
MVVMYEIMKKLLKINNNIKWTQNKNIFVLQRQKTLKVQKSNNSAFSSPFKPFRQDDDPHLITTLLSPFNSLNTRMITSPFSLSSLPNYEENHPKNREDENPKIEEFISFMGDVGE